MASVKQKQRDQIGRDWQRQFDEMWQGWRSEAKKYGRGVAGALVDCGAGYLISLAAGAQAAEAARALAKGFLSGLVGFVGAAAFVAVVFTVIARLRPQALSLGARKEPKRARRWWLTHVLVIPFLALFAFGPKHLGSAFFGGFVLGFGAVALPGMLFVTSSLYRGLIEPDRTT